jgi:hypothetical protein
MDLEVSTEERQPPGSGLLDQVSVSAIWQRFDRGLSVDRKKPKPGYCSKILDDGFQVLGFDMLEDIDATGQIRRLGWPVLGESGVIRQILDIDPAQFEHFAEVTLARTVI